MNITQLISRYPIISDQIEVKELQVILEQCSKVLAQNIRGEIVEFGCYVGTTSLFLRRLLNEAESSKQLHVYDSFAGLPDKLSQDLSPAGEQFKAGELKATKQALIKHFKQAHLQLPIIHKGWFNELTDVDVPDAIAFAFLDGDYYDSIQSSLRLIEQKLQPGSVIVIDDYQSEALPGARRATDEWLNKKGYAHFVAHSLAVIQVP